MCPAYCEWRKTLDASRKQYDLKSNKLLDIEDFVFIGLREDLKLRVTLSVNGEFTGLGR